MRVSNTLGSIINCTLYKYPGVCCYASQEEAEVPQRWPFPNCLGGRNLQWSVFGGGYNGCQREADVAAADAVRTRGTRLVSLGRSLPLLLST
jgi:hypothetical protein